MKYIKPLEINENTKVEEATNYIIKRFEKLRELNKDNKIIFLDINRTPILIRKYSENKNKYILYVSEILWDKLENSFNLKYTDIQNIIKINFEKILNLNVDKILCLDDNHYLFTK